MACNQAQGSSWPADLRPFLHSGGRQPAVERRRVCFFCRTQPSEAYSEASPQDPSASNSNSSSVPDVTSVPVARRRPALAHGTISTCSHTAADRSDPERAAQKAPALLNRFWTALTLERPRSPRKALEAGPSTLRSEALSRSHLQHRREPAGSSRSLSAVAGSRRGIRCRFSLRV